MTKNLPPHARKVFAGEIFTIWQWEQEMYDGSVEIFEKAFRPDTVQVFAMMGEDVLFAEEEQPDRDTPFYSLFGGRMDVPGEDPLVAAKRELLEEAGLTSDDWELLLQHEQTGKLCWTTYTFVARDCRKVADQQLDAGEKVAIQRLPIVQFLDEILQHPRFRTVDVTRALCDKPNEEKIAAFIQQLQQTQQ